MSFASRAREEIAQRSLQKDCCVRAAAYGFACFAKYFDKGGLVLQTEQPHTVQLARELFARCGVQGDVLEKQRPSGVLYEFNIREPEQVARMHELFGTTGSETSLQIDPALIRCQTCVSAYIGAAFLCSGTVTDPQKEYNLEFLTARTNLARDFEALLAEHEFAPHRTRRNGVNLIYVKTGANVERLLSFMGAGNAAEEMHAQKAFKQVRNQTNRQTNCDTANLGKTARANAQTLKAIQEAEAYHGPSLIIGYAPCEMHSIKGGMQNCQTEMKKAVECGYWNMFRFNPAADKKFTLDSKAPAGGYREFLMNEARYSRLTREFPERAEGLFTRNEDAAKERYEHLTKLIDLYDKQ